MWTCYIIIPPETPQTLLVLKGQTWKTIVNAVNMANQRM